MRACPPDQFPALQIKALRQAGCENVFTRKASGAQREYLAKPRSAFAYSPGYRHHQPRQAARVPRLQVVAEFERELTLERTHAGLAQARALGRRGKRKPAMGPAEIKRAKAMLAEPTMTVEEVAQQLGPAERLRQTAQRAAQKSLELPNPS